MNGWGEGNPFEYQGNGIYTVSVEFTGGETTEFKVASSDWATVDFGSGDQVVTLDTDKTLARAAANLQFSPAETATYMFILNAVEPEAPVLTVRTDDPYPGTTVFMRGGMNGWGESDPFTFDGGRMYSLDAVITAGDYEFKVASSDWSTVDFGAPDSGPTVEMGVEKPLGSSGNLSATFDTDSSYVFIFSVVADPTLLVFDGQFFGSTTVFLRGSMNGWGESDAINYQGRGVYSVDLALTAGNHEFKVASSDWATVNLGAENGDNADVVLGEAEGLFTTNDNLRLALDADGTYRFTVRGANGEAPTVTVDAQ